MASNHVMTVSSVGAILNKSRGCWRYATSALAMQRVPATQFRKLVTACGLAVSKSSISRFLVIILSTSMVRAERRREVYTYRSRRAPRLSATGLSSFRCSRLPGSFPVVAAQSLGHLCSAIDSPNTIACLASATECAHADRRTVDRGKSDRETRLVPKTEDSRVGYLRLREVSTACFV